MTRYYYSHKKVDNVHFLDFHFEILKFALCIPAHAVFGFLQKSVSFCRKLIFESPVLASFPQENS